MNSHCKYLVCIALYACFTYGRASAEYPDYSSSSGFASVELDDAARENLEVLCRVWGYVKYHHPVFADTVVDADYELFGLLPRTVKTTADGRNRILADWIEKLGPTVRNDEFYAEAFALPHVFTVDLGWTRDTARLGVRLSELLQDMRYADRRANRYVNKNGYATVKFDGEKPYKLIRADLGYRLLGLFRLWNAVEYYCPNKSLTDKPWDAVLTQYIPLMESASDKKAYYLAFMRLVVELHDSHSFLYDGYIFGTKTVPARAVFLADRLIVTDTLGTTPLAPGDRILEVDGRAVQEAVALSETYIPASNRSGLLREAAKAALRSFTVSDSAQVRFVREGCIIDTVSPVYDMSSTELSIPRNNRPVYSFLNDSVGYVHMENFTLETGDTIMALYKDAKAIVIDMRCYPKEYLIPEFIRRYLVESPDYYITFLTPEPILPGYFWYDPFYPVGIPGRSQKRQKNPGYYKGKILLLVNEQTQSMAEMAEMAFQSIPGCVTVGSRSAGANGNITQIVLPGGLTTYFSGLGCYYPDGKNAQRSGVRIDCEVRPTAEGIRAGRDEVLEAALRFVR